MAFVEFNFYNLIKAHGKNGCVQYPPWQKWLCAIVSVNAHDDKTMDNFQ